MCAWGIWTAINVKGLCLDCCQCSTCWSLDSDTAAVKLKLQTACRNSAISTVKDEQDLNTMHVSKISVDLSRVKLS